MKALRQLEVTAERLIMSGRRVDMAVVVVKGFDRKERQIFTRGKDSGLFRKDRRRQKMKVKGIPVYVYLI